MENIGYILECVVINQWECFAIKYIMDDSNYLTSNSSTSMLYRPMRPDEVVKEREESDVVYDGIVKDTRRTVRGDDRVHVRHTDEFIEDYVQYLESDDGEEEESSVQYYIGQNAPLFIHGTCSQSDFDQLIRDYAGELEKGLGDLNIPSELRYMMVYTFTDSNTVQDQDVDIDDERDPLDDDTENDPDVRFLLICPFVGIEYLQVIRDSSLRFKDDLSERVVLLPGGCPLVNRNMELTFVSRGKVLVSEWSDAIDDLETQVRYFISTPRITVCADDPIRISEEMIKILSNEEKNHFIDDTTLFMNLGKILFNLYYNDRDTALETWTKTVGITDDNPVCTVDNIEYDAEDLEDLLSEFAIDNHLSHKSLIWYARTLEYKRYREWSDRWYKEGIIFHTNHYHALAQLFFKMYPDRFIATDGGKRWYYYENGMWSLDDGNLQFKNLLNTEFLSYIKCVLIPEYNNRKLSETIIKDLIKIEHAIAKPYFKNNIIADAAYYYRDARLHNKLDANKSLLNTANCLIDFSNNNKNNRQVYIRDPMPEDFITKRITVGYNKKFHKGHKRIKLIEDFFRKVFPDEETRYRSCIIFASFLVGGNKDKKIYIMSGPKDSSKSTFKMFFLDRILNNEPEGYARDAPVEALIRGNRNSSQANPELAQAKNCKVVTFTEPEKDVTFEASMIKRITGGDTSFGRGLYENGGSIKSTFKYVIQCNTIPILKSYDLPALERFFIIPFLSKFSDNAPESEEEQWAKRIFPKDDTMQDNTGKYAEAMFWYILQFIPKYFEEGIKPSAEMTAKINEYVSRNDIYMEFILSDIVKHEDSYLSTRELVSAYREWHKKTYSGGTYPSSTDLKESLLSRLDNVQIVNRNGIESIRGYTTRARHEMMESE